MNESLFLFISLVFIVFGILQIILFFKLWGMTNDVKKIKNILVSPPPTDNPIKKDVATAFILGNKNRAEELLIQSFLKDLENIPVTGNDFFSKKIRGIKDQYRELFIKIGKEFPTEFEQIQSIADRNNLLNLRYNADLPKKYTTTTPSSKPIKEFYPNDLVIEKKTGIQMRINKENADGTYFCTRENNMPIGNFNKSEIILAEEE